MSSPLSEEKNDSASALSQHWPVRPTERATWHRWANVRTNPGLLSGQMPYVRTVKTASGATAVQIVYPSRRGSWDIEHLGSAHDDASWSC
jgi:hypothetical protein